MAAVAAVLAHKRIADKRLEKRREKEDSHTFVQQILKKYDTSKSGGLKYEELKLFLGELHSGCTSEITEGEVKWVIQMATPQKEIFTPGEWELGLRQLEGPSLEVAAKEWLQYLRNYDEISEVFDRHSNDHSGFLDRSKLKAVLVELNEGHEILEDDVDKVMSQASIVSHGQVSKPDFVKAISVWYSIDDERKALALLTNGDSCCVLS